MNTENKKTAIDLKEQVSIWVDRRFNEITEDNFTTVLSANGLELFELIREKDRFDDFWIEELQNRITPHFVEWLYANSSEFEFTADTQIDTTGEDSEEDEDEIKERVLLECAKVITWDKYESDIREYIENELSNEYQEFCEGKDDNYPMHSTLFEFKSEPTQSYIDHFIAAGFGVIEKSDYWNTTLFVSGAGYSFLGAHWIPAFLSAHTYEAEKYSHISREEIGSL